MLAVTVEYKFGGSLVVRGKFAIELDSGGIRSFSNICRAFEKFPVIFHLGSVATVSNVFLLILPPVALTKSTIS